MTDARLLDNIMWNCLSGPHAHFAAGSGAVRRYARGFSPMVGFQDPQAPDFDGLAALCEPDEPFYCDNWTGPAPAGWRIEAESTMYRMLWAGGPAPACDGGDDGAVRLGPQHVVQAMELAALTKPGPFGPRTIELGDYFGFFEDGRLVAMAGERMQAGRLREISGVCTHPAHQGRGLARRLMDRLLAAQLGRGQTPFLHVMRANQGARLLYERLGFRVHAEAPVRVLARTPAKQQV